MSQFTQSPNFPAALLTVNRHELDGDPMIVTEGKIPDDLQGHAFILAAAGFADSKTLAGTSLVLPSIHGNPAINSDGMIFRLDFHKHGQESKPNEVWLKTKIVGTPSYWADKAAVKKQEYAALKFYNFGLARLSAWLGVRNPSNTGWLSMKFPEENSRLFVTLDAGRSHEIDTESLEVVTPLGWNKEWVPQINLKLPFPLLMSTAHPYFDPRTNEVFTVNYCKSIETILRPIIKQNFAGYKKNSSIVKELLEQFRTKLKFKVKHTKDIKKINRYLVNLLQLSKLGLQVIENTKNLQDVTYLMRWDGKGDLERWKLVHPDGTPVVIQQTMHAIGVTQDYIVLMDTSLKIGLAQLIDFKNKKIEKALREVLDYPQLPDSNIYIVPRAQLIEGERPACCNPKDPETKPCPECQEKIVVVQKLTIPREAFHFHVNYENPDGKITLHAIHSCAWDVSEWMSKIDIPLTNNRRGPIGMMIDSMDINQMGRYEIDAKTGKLVTEPILTYNLDYTWAVGLYTYSNNKHGNNWWPPARFENIYLNSYGAWKDLLPEFIYDIYENYKYREIPAEKVRKITNDGVPSSLCRLDVEQMQIGDGYQFPSGYFVNSPLFVPRANGTGGSTDGYIICTVNYDPDRCNRLKSAKSEIWIFNADNLQDGPLCKLSHPQLNFAFTTHTTWLSEIAPRQAGIYCIPLKEDLQESLKQVAPEFPKIQALIEKLFDQEVYPHFP
jgi:carotenoid cleavage dioxygenase-like enzyme